jgi:hypothetical protein
LFGDEHPLSDADNVKALRFRLRHRSPNRLRHPTGIRARRT